MIARSLMFRGTFIKLTFAKGRNDMKDLLRRTVQWLSLSGVTTQEIHDLLIKEGLTENEAALTYKGAKLILSKRMEEMKVA